uniref:Uncharacterized protein n=1 Tax=Arundo donax TaxID=35708 RepID=A0A0A9A6B9_ARUDO
MYTDQLHLKHSNNQLKATPNQIDVLPVHLPQHPLQRPRSRHESVVLHLGRPVRRPPPRREPAHPSQPRRRCRGLRLHLLHLPPPRRGSGRWRRWWGLVNALHGVPRRAAAHQETEPAAAAGGPRPQRPRRAPPEGALAVGEHLPDAGHLGRSGLRDGGLGRAPAAAGPGLLGEHGRRVVPPRAALAELP